jgi:hypothetical protein
VGQGVGKYPCRRPGPSVIQFDGLEVVTL